MMPPLLVSNLINIQYLTGLHMTAGVLLLHGEKKILFVDDRYTEKAMKEKRRGIQIAHIKDLKKRIRRFKRVRFESNDLTHARLQHWKKEFRGTKLLPSVNVIEEMRRKKKPDEVVAIRKACRITDKILQDIPKILASACRGVARYAPTEKKLAW